MSPQMWGVENPDVFRRSGAPWYRAGNRDQRMTSSAAFGPAGINTVRAVPFWSGRGGVIGQLAFSVVGLAAAGGVGRMGIYTSTPGTLYPLALVVDGGQQVTDAAAGLKTSVVVVTLAPMALYWFVDLFGVSIVGLTTTGYSAGDDADGLLGSATGVSFCGWGWSVAQAYGALPVAFPGGAAVLDQGTRAPFLMAQYTSY